MPKPMIRIYIGNDEFIDREMTDTEYVIYQADGEAEAARQAEADAKAAQRQALLNRLGITEEEARILLGGN